MQAEIIGENDDGVGVDVTDNNGALHEISIEKDSLDIVYHKCEGYPNNPAKRTTEQTEYGKQAKRFARWHVYRERGYDTVPPTDNPDRILASLLAITMLSEQEFEAHFGDLRGQIKSHYDGSTVDLPFRNADPDGAIVYQKDVYLTPDPIDFDPPVLDQFRGRFGGESDSSVVPEPGSISLEEMDRLEFDIEAVSGLHYLYNSGQGREQSVKSKSPLDRDPDTTVELMPFDLAEIDSFQHYVVSHLAYQIRDCFLLMGLRPPAAFQATGWGKYRGFMRQKFCPQYEDYWSSSTTVESWDPE